MHRTAITIDEKNIIQIFVFKNIMLFSLESLRQVKSPVSLRTGSQLKAARALAQMNQTDLAKRAGVNVNTIRAMEGRGSGILVSGLDTVAKVQRALEAAGIVFIPENGGGAGVRLAQPAGASD